jgi:hypothetical protein
MDTAQAAIFFLLRGQHSGLRRVDEPTVEHKALRRVGFDRRGVGSYVA